MRRRRRVRASISDQQGGINAYSSHCHARGYVTLSVQVVRAIRGDQQEGQAIQGAVCVQDFPTAAAPDPRATVVMCGLDNPRGLTFSQSALYVAEAGRGGLGLTDPEFFQGQVGAIR